MKEQTPHIDILESHRPSLTEAKKDSLWQAIEAKVQITPVPSPFFFTYFRKNSMAPLALVVGLLLGAGTTVAASDTARPGDLLFPLDQALEEARLALARNDDSRVRLQIAYAEERLNELRSILDEDGNRPVNDATPTPVEVIDFEAEADVFSNITIVTVEINDRKTTFETFATTRADVIDEILRRYDVDRARVDAALDFKIEDRASRASDIVSSDDDRIMTALELFDQSVSNGGVSGSEKSRLISELLVEFHGADRVRIDDDRIEVRDGNERIEIRQKDGETEVRIKSDDGDRDDDDEREDDDYRHRDSDTRSNDDDDDTQDEEDDKDDSRDDNHNDNTQEDSSHADDSDESDDSNERVRIEVEVEDGEASVRLEYNGTKDEFTLPYENQSDLIDALSDRSGLSQSIISQNLDLEVKD